MNWNSFLIANWKMNFSIEQAVALLQSFRAMLQEPSPVYVGVAPNMLCIPACLEAARGSELHVGAQNAHWKDSGAFTGEVSAHTLKQMNASFILCGHSERRHQFSESNQLVASRTLGILEQNLPVVYCVGETLEQRESGQTNKVLREQLEIIFACEQPELLSNLLIAYEPVWAIGTGKVAQISEIREAHCYIESLWKLPRACPPILYGGSVKADNYSAILEIPEVQGALVGGASLDLESFKALYRIALAQA